MVKEKTKVSKKQKKLITYAFIDSQNLNLGVRSQGWRLDFARFRIYLTDKYKVKKAFLFIGFIPKNKELYEFLINAGYTLVYKPVVESKKHAKTLLRKFSQYIVNVDLLRGKLKQ